MTSVECFENKWFYMKYIRKYLSTEILLFANIDLSKFCLPMFLKHIFLEKYT